MVADRWDRVRYAWQEGNYPLTKWIIVLNIATLIASAFTHSIGYWLAFDAPVSLARPWTLLTYPFVSFDPIGLIFYGLWLYWVGGSLERSWGTRFYAGYLAAMSVITALGMSAGAALLHGIFPVNETLPLAALTVAWCMLNPDLEIRLWGIVPILAKWLAVGEVLIIFFTHARMHPLFGFFALSGCAASYLWVRTRAWSDVHLYSSMPYAPRPKKQKVQRGPRDDKFSMRDLNPFERMARARRKKQFERLMKDD